MGTGDWQYSFINVQYWKYSSGYSEFLVVEWKLWYVRSSPKRRIITRIFLISICSVSAFHKISFITFLIMALVHMLLACLIMKSCQSPTKDALEANSLKWKWRLMLLNVASILLACYFFYRHNKYCEPLGKLIMSYNN